MFYVTFGGDSIEYQLRTSKEVRRLTEESLNRVELRNLWQVNYISNRSIDEMIESHIKKFGGEKKKLWPGYGIDFIVHKRESEKRAREIGDYYAERSKVLNSRYLASEILKEEGMVSI